MDYPLEELVRVSGLPVDTIRYYQTLGLLDPPSREGRRAIYHEGHVDRLRLIRSLSGKGLSLRAIGMLLRRGVEATADSDQVLLAAVEEEASEPSWTSEELAERLGVPRALVASVESAGLAEGQEQPDGTMRYGEADLRIARGALRLLEHGFPLTRLLGLAIRHDRAIRRTVDGAIDLFDDHVRKRSREAAAGPEAVARAFQELLPIVTAVVAHHFQRLLVNRALKRLRKSGEKGELEVALRVASRTRLGLRWK